MQNLFKFCTDFKLCVYRICPLQWLIWNTLKVQLLHQTPAQNVCCHQFMKSWTLWAQWMLCNPLKKLTE